MKTRRVLLIDDDPKALEKHSRLLSGASYAVFTARNCREAAGILRKHRGRMVVLSELDVDSRSMIGFMIERLKDYPYLPFSFLVSSPSIESAVDALKAGASDYLRKPATKESLCRSLEGSADRMQALLRAERLEKGFRNRLSRSQEDLRSAKTLSFFKGFLISMAAHDFRTILTVLDGYLQFLRDKCSGCPVAEEDGLLRRANRTVTRLLAMANTLLDYEAAETGRLRMEIKPFPLEDALKDCMAFYKPYADMKQVDFVLHPIPDGITVLGDREKTMEILDNLLYNALKFTPAKGRILLSGRKEEDRVVISIIDSGAGMPKEQVRHLFDPEEMGAPLDSRARIGLGMVICKKLVEAQNGEIAVNSILGKGTTVSILLPCI